MKDPHGYWGYPDVMTATAQAMRYRMWREAAMVEVAYQMSIRIGADFTRAMDQLAAVFAHPTLAQALRRFRAAEVAAAEARAERARSAAAMRAWSRRKGRRK